MPIKYTTVFIFLIALNGCATSSALERSADNNVKAGKYYESIGQSEVAEQHRKIAAQNRKDSRKFSTLLFDIFFDNDDKEQN
ncbi:hypothetical protein [Thalassotalea agariperforans]